MQASQPETTAPAWAGPDGGTDEAGQEDLLP